MDNKRRFYWYIRSKRKTRANEDPLLNGNRDLVTNDVKKGEVLNVFFT